jgi:hypothetical protein
MSTDLAANRRKQSGDAIADGAHFAVDLNVGF